MNKLLSDYNELATSYKSILIDSNLVTEKILGLADMVDSNSFLGIVTRLGVISSRASLVYLSITDTDLNTPIIRIDHDSENKFIQASLEYLYQVKTFIRDISSYEKEI